MTVARFDELTTQLLSLCPHVDLISFDIFDTLLERHVEPPDAVKAVAAELATRHFFLVSEVILGPELILSARHDIEIRLRTKAKDEGFDYECAFSEIAREISRLLAPAWEDALFDILIEAELEAEQDALYPKMHVVNLLTSLKALGKKVVVTSDMYLDSSLLQRLFKHLGLDGLIDHFYVSSDLKLGKYSGRLFGHVLRTENVEPQRMVHIGDHPHSDVVAPRSLGIHAIHLLDSASLRRRQVLKTLSRLGARNPYWKGEHLLAIVPPSKEEDFFFRYGYQCLGPVFCGFVLGVMEEIERRSVNKVFFLAREGDLFRELYVKLAQSLARSLPAADYLYVSRRSVFLPAAWCGLKRKYLDVLLCNPKQRGLFSLAEALGVSAIEFEGVASSLGISVDQPIVGWDDEQYECLLNCAEFQAIVIRHAKPARDLLREYLDQQGFFSSPTVAYVDIGWNGTIQYALQDAFNTEVGYPETLGLYMGYNGGFGYEFPRHQVSGVLFDRRKDDLKHNVFAFFAELFENAARAHHGTTLSYQKWEDGKVRPVLRGDDTSDRVAERNFEGNAFRLRQGVVAFADAFAKAIRLTGYELKDIKPALLSLAERIVVHPTHEEVSELLKIVHAEDFGSSNLMDFSEYRLPGLSALVHPVRLVQQLRISNWKYGTAKTLGLPGFNHLIRYVQLTAAKTNPLCESMPSPSMMDRMLLFAAKKGCFKAVSLFAKLFPMKWRRYARGKLSRF